MVKDDIKPGRTFTGARWKGDRKVGKVYLAWRDGRFQSVVQYLDLRTNAVRVVLLDAFLAGATGFGLVANV